MLLERMKKGVSKVVIQLLAVLLIASFALWGVGDMVGVISSPDEVATVGGGKISRREFQEAYRRGLDDLRGRLGDLSPDDVRALEVARETLASVVFRRLVDMQALDMGLLVGDEQIARSIRSDSRFRDVSGGFDRAGFQAALANSGLTEGAYVAALRGDLRRGLIDDAVRGGVAAPPGLADVVHRFRSETRSFEAVRIRRGSSPPPQEPSDADLAAHLEADPAPFASPEYRRLTLLRLDPEETAKEMSPAPERVREEYENRLDELSEPERRRLEQILVDDEDAARAARAAVAAGRDFAAVAAEAAPGRERDLGLVAKDDLLPEIAEAAFALPAGGVGAPVRTPLGWHLVRVAEIRPRRTPSFEEARGGIERELARELALDDLVRRGNRIEDALAGGAALEEAAREAGARARRVGPVDIDGKLRTGAAAAGLPSDPRFAALAFSTEEGRSTDLTEASDGGYFMLRVDEVIAAGPRPLPEVRDAVRSAWRRARRDAAAKKTAEEVLKELGTGRPLAAVAADRALEVERGGPVDRSGGDSPPLPPGLLAELFAARQGQAFLGPVAEGYAVVRAGAAEAAAPDRGSEAYGALARGLAAALADGLLREYGEALRREYAVVVNHAALDALLPERR